ncbi:MAG: protein kinase [Verrucomicrobiales bacterium]|nr:protein kinase [Verrucomicrobiales bacterium]
MDDKPQCAKCGAPLGRGVFAGLCPVCMLEAGLPRDLDGEPQAARADAAPGKGQGWSPGLSRQGRFGDYELLEEIGHGGMGVVYRARQVSLDREVAVKFLLLGTFSSGDVTERFRREAVTAGSLRHPNIVTIHEVGEIEGQPFFAMEYVRGSSLAEVIAGRRGRGLDSRQAAQWVKTIAEAIHYAHQQGVLHRDLKPSNILLDETGQVRITDFGLAKRLADPVQLTVTGQTLGSPSHLAPIWPPLGIATVPVGDDLTPIGPLYELLTGRPPFLSESIQETLIHIREREPVPPRLLNAGVPRDLEVICLKCLEKSPERRFASAEAVAEDLGRYLRGEPIQARPVGLSGKLWRWCRRKPALASAVGGLILVLATGFAGVLSQWRRAELNAEQHAREASYSTIALADSQIREGNVDQALEALLECPEEFRNWDWGHLMFRCHQAVLSLTAHTNAPSSERGRMSSRRPPVAGLSFSGDAAHLVTAGSDGTLGFWSLEEGQCLVSVGTPDDRVLAFAVAPNRPRWAVARAAGEIELWNGASAQGRIPLNVAGAPVRQLVFSADGQRLAWATERQIGVWDLDQGRAVLEAREFPESVDSIAYSPQGLVVRHGLAVDLFELDTGRRVRRLQLPSEEGRARFVPPQAGYSVSLDSRNRLRLHPDDSNSRDLATVTGSQPGLLRRVFFSAGGQRFCNAGDQGTARVWDAPTGAELWVVPDRVHQAVFSPDGNSLATSGGRNLVHVWDLETGKEALTLRGHSALIERLAFSPDGRLLATADTDGAVKVWSAGTGREVLSERSCMWAPAVTPDGKFIFGAPWNDEFVIWDAESGQPITRVQTPTHLVVRAAMFPDGRRVVTAGSEKIARIWQIPTGRPLLVLRGHERSLCALEVSPTGKRIATGSWDGTARIWDADTGESLFVLDHGTNRFVWTSFSPDGRRLATVDEDAIWIWEVESGRRLARYQTGQSRPDRVLWFKDGRRLLTCNLDRNMAVWDARSGKELRRWTTRGAAGNPSFSADGKRLVAVSAREFLFGYDVPSAEIWDPETGRHLLTLAGHRDPANNARFAPAGAKIVSSSFDATLRQWEAFPWREADYPDAGSKPFRERIEAYSRAYWQARLTAEARGRQLASTRPLETQFIRDTTLWPARDRQAGPDQVDLADFYNGVLDAPFHPFYAPGQTDNDLAELPTGTVQLAGVWFDIRGVIQLRRAEPLGGFWQLNWERYPEAVNGIPLNRRVRRIHILHGATGAIADGEPIGGMRLHYADGAQAEFDVVYGRHLRSWWTQPAPEGDVSDGKLAWSGSNPVAQDQGARLRLYVVAFDNPHPDLEVTTLDLLSRMTTSAWFVIALTVE